MTDTRLPSAPMLELTLRGVILGALITFVFTAANVYLGLKVGLTFATSIPAAVISMAILRFFATATILENNIVQTIASAAGTLAAIIFVLPGLVMVGWWQGFPYWTTAAVCAMGGILGVMFSVPLRRALVTGSDLPYPEGVAAAEVLKVGAESRAGEEENARGLEGHPVRQPDRRRIRAAGRHAAGGGRGGAFLQAGGGERDRHHREPLDGADRCRAPGRPVGRHRDDDGHADRLGGAGADPDRRAAGRVDPVADVVNTVFRSQVRFIGAGVIGVAAIWTLLKIIGPIVGGVASAIAASRRAGAGRCWTLTERDLPIGIVGAVVALSMIPIAWLLWDFSAGGPVRDYPLLVIGGTLVYVVVIGIVIAAVCGYMAGLHRRVEQPGVGRRHPRRPCCVVVAGDGVRARCRSGGHGGAGRLCAVRDRDRVLHRDHLQRQSAGPEDRATGRRDAVAAAGRAGARRGLRQRW